MKTNLTKEQVDEIAEWMRTEKWGISGMYLVMNEIRNRFVEVFLPKESEKQNHMEIKLEKFNDIIVNITFSNGNKFNSCYSVPVDEVKKALDEYYKDKVKPVGLRKITDLSNCKIWVNGDINLSNMINNKARSLGWGTKDDISLFMSGHVSICFNQNKSVTFADKEYFDKSNYKEIFVDQLFDNELGGWFTGTNNPSDLYTQEAAKIYSMEPKVKEDENLVERKNEKTKKDSPIFGAYSTSTMHGTATGMVDNVVVESDGIGGRQVKSNHVNKGRTMKVESPSPKAYILQKDTIGRCLNEDRIIPKGEKFVYFELERYVSSPGRWVYSKKFVEENPEWFIEFLNKEDALAAIQAGKITPLQFMLMDKHY